MQELNASTVAVVQADGSDTVDIQSLVGAVHKVEREGEFKKATEWEREVSIPTDADLGDVEISLRRLLIIDDEQWRIAEVTAGTGGYTRVRCLRQSSGEYTRQRLNQIGRNK